MELVLSTLGGDPLFFLGSACYHHRHCENHGRIEERATAKKMQIANVAVLFIIREVLDVDLQKKWSYGLGTSDDTTELVVDCDKLCVTSPET